MWDREVKSCFFCSAEYKPVSAACIRMCVGSSRLRLFFPTVTGRGGAAVFSPSSSFPLFPPSFHARFREKCPRETELRMRRRNGRNEPLHFRGSAHQVDPPPPPPPSFEPSKSDGNHHHALLLSSVRRLNVGRKRTHLSLPLLLRPQKSHPHSLLPLSLHRIPMPACCLPPPVDVAEKVWHTLPPSSLPPFLATKVLENPGRKEISTTMLLYRIGRRFRISTFSISLLLFRRRRAIQTADSAWRKRGRGGGIRGGVRIMERGKIIPWEKK